MTHPAEAPDVRVFHRPAGWTIPTLEPGPQTCTVNHQPEPTPCTNTAAWKVVELHDLHATFSFWCDRHLPDEHRQTPA